MKQYAVDEYQQIGKVRISRGLFGGRRDPSDEVGVVIERHLRSQQDRFTQHVRNTFDLPDEGVTKFEFPWRPQRVELQSDSKEPFRTTARITLLYLKSSSLIYFRTDYSFSVVRGCSSKVGAVRAFGGRDFELTEIYFNKITTVSAYHQEKAIMVVSPGCFGREAKFNYSEDGFTIRAGENFQVVALEAYRSELNSARSLINKRVSEVN